MLTPPTSFEAILDDIWMRLECGSTDRRHAFHLPTIASVTPEGIPDARIVVLRGADRASRTIRCHTDLRAPKVAQLRANPHAAWTWYDPSERVQVRAMSTVDVHQGDADPIASDAWAKTALWSRRCYLAPNAPTEPCDTRSKNLPVDVESRPPTEQETMRGVDNFTVLRATVTSFDWLHLAHDGNHRVRFVLRDGGFDATWLQP
ncbi:MAG: pyridoxamine 5'-phosphate oxidase family protein [Planctomycetota bacterium]